MDATSTTSTPTVPTSAIGLPRLHDVRGTRPGRARLLLDWAVATLDVTGVSIEVEPDNARSIAVAERLGFVRAEGVERIDGARSLHVYELTIQPPAQRS